MYLKILLKNIGFAVLIVVLIGFWQTRDLPSGLAPVVEVKSMEGNRVILIDPEQSKVTLVYFFATWCGVCRLSMGNLDTLKNWFPSLEVKAVALDYESPGEVSLYLAEHNLDVKTYLGDDAAKSAYGISAFPTYYVVGIDQRIHGNAIGYSSLAGMVLRVLWTKFF